MARHGSCCFKGPRWWQSCLERLRSNLATAHRDGHAGQVFSPCKHDRSRGDIGVWMPVQVPELPSPFRVTLCVINAFVLVIQPVRFFELMQPQMFPNCV